MAARPRRIAVIEAGHPRADSLAALFLLFGYGGLSIASHLRRQGFEVEYFPMFISTRLDERYLASCDYLLVSTMVHTAKLGYALADRLRRRPGRPPVVVFGGPHPTCEPEETLEHCDFVVLNEGEETVVELLRHLEGAAGADPDPGTGSSTGSRYPRHIDGLAFRGPDGEVVYTPRRAALREIDFALDPALIHRYRGIHGNLLASHRLRFPFPVVQFSRGCPYSCTFCLGMRQLGQQYRTRPAASVIADLERFGDLTRFPYGMFHDNDVAIRRGETKDLLRAMARARPRIRVMSAFTRVDSTKDEELWRLFDEAGIANVFFGVESLRQASLDGFQKGTTVDGIHAAMERLDRYGVKAKIVASFVVGDGDDPRAELALIRDFWRRYWRRLQRVVIQPLMEYPFQQKLRGQSQLYGDEKFIHYDWDYFSGDFLVFYPKAVPPSVLQDDLRRTFRCVHGVPAGSGADWSYRRAQALIRYTHRDKDRNLGVYCEFLRARERGKYDRQGCLRPETLEDDVKPRELGLPTTNVLRPRSGRWRTAGRRRTAAAPAAAVPRLG
jgi:anaerobic magnesium-protoporphyrin IX monomethyl ester cyclase